MNPVLRTALDCFSSAGMLHRTYGAQINLEILIEYYWRSDSDKFEIVLFHNSNGISDKISPGVTGDPGCRISQSVNKHTKITHYYCK